MLFAHPAAALCAQTSEQGMETSNARILMAKSGLRRYHPMDHWGIRSAPETVYRILALSGRNFPFMKKEIQHRRRVNTNSASTMSIKVWCRPSGGNIFLPAR